MTTPHDPNGPTGGGPEREDDLRDSRDDDAMRALLKRSMGPVEHAPPPRDLLRGVQRRIRVRSRGRFFADGWSTGDSRISYGLVALVMLVILGLAWYALGPLGVSR